MTTASPPDSTSDAPLPWQRDAWQRLRPLAGGARPPHALLLAGSAGLGKRRLALALVRALLCSRADGGDTGQADPLATGCGVCPDCRQFAVGSHPDFRLIEAEPGKPIRIDQIRALGEFVVLSRHGGRLRIAVIDGAERMTASAANCLLKTLEEPPPGRLLLLLSASPSRLPATVRSRCQRLSLNRPPSDLACDWLRRQLPDVAAGDAERLLRLAGNAPLRALALAAPDGAETAQTAPRGRGRDSAGDGDSGLQRRQRLFAAYRDAVGGAATTRDAAAASLWAKGDLNLHLIWLHGWLLDILRLQLAGPALRDELLENPDLRHDLNTLAARLPAARWMQLLQTAQQLLLLSATASQINFELQLEAFFQSHTT